jgi:hypothetical protein
LSEIVTRFGTDACAEQMTPLHVEAAPAKSPPCAPQAVSATTVHAPDGRQQAPMTGHAAVTQAVPLPWYVPPAAAQSAAGTKVHVPLVKQHAP